MTTVYRSHGKPRVITNMTLPAVTVGVFIFMSFFPAQTGLAASDWHKARPVDKEEIVAAMRLQQALGYELTTISNAVRLQVSVFLQLADWAMINDPQHYPLRVNHDDYFEAFLEVTGLQLDAAPDFVTVPHRFGEDYLIDYHIENVVKRVKRGEQPRRALNVKAGWPEGPDAPSRYSFVDASTRPIVKVTHRQVNTYRILDFDEFIVYDDIRGVTGRATSGVLGAIFSLIGEARAIQTRFTVSADGIQISRTKAKKIISVTQTVTVYPDGSVLRGLPSNRPDLADLEKMLKRRMEIKYVPMGRGPIPPAEQPSP